MAFLLLLLLNGGLFDSHDTLTPCVRLGDAIAGCQMSVGMGAARLTPCESLVTYMCSLATSPCMHSRCPP